MTSPATPAIAEAPDNTPDPRVSRSGPIPGPLGRALARIYAAEIGRRNRRFDQGEGVARLDRPVISVGNLSVGGTGKTPMVAWIVRALLEHGRRPCVAMRGYRAKGGISDEAAIYQKLFMELPIVAQPDRAQGLRELFARAGGSEINAVVLDDGFQHRKIARDLDIVLVDASRNPFEDGLLPGGWLREPVESLRRAGAVVLTHAELAPSGAIERLSQEVERAGGSAPIAVTRHAWTGLDVQRHSGEGRQELSWLDGQRVVCVCAIGNPEAFLAEARALVGDRLVDSIVMRDHDSYNAPAVRRLCRRAERAKADVILTTEKDWVKLARAPVDLWPCPVARPILELAFDRGREDLERLVLETAGP